MMQSPTSINTYLQCPRKYYYKYIRRIPMKENVYALIGTIAHKVLADFVSKDSGDYSVERLMNVFDETWKRNKSPLVRQEHYGEIKVMLENWHNQLIIKTNGKRLDDYLKFAKAEQKLKSEEYNVCGVLDLLNETEGSIVEYKTSSKPELTREYKIQLGIYALLFLETFKKLPEKVFIHFLKHGKKEVPFTPGLLNDAKRICKLVNLKTLKSDMREYPKRKCSLCKWSNGQCDFYEECFPNNIKYQSKI